MKRAFKIITIFYILMLTPISVSAQKAERKNVREGNKQYEKDKYTESEIAYRKALETNPKSKEGTYNLGNSLYKQEKIKEALEQYQIALSLEADPLERSSVLHNAGNSFMQAKDYSNAVASYRMSLRFNPNDNETRYNLAVAQAYLKNQQQQQQKDKKDDKKDENKENKENKEQQQSQDDQEKKQNDQQKQDQQQQEEQVSKEKAQQLLDALTQDEKETQEKVRNCSYNRADQKSLIRIGKLLINFASQCRQVW